MSSIKENGGVWGYFIGKNFNSVWNLHFQWQLMTKYRSRISDEKSASEWKCTLCVKYHTGF